MADLSDVLNVLRDTLAAVLYPNGVPNTPAPQSIAGCAVRVYVGWPDTSLDTDLRQGIAHLSIFPRPGMARERNVYLTGWVTLPGPAPSITATVSADVATFAGAGTTPQMIAAVVVDGKPYTYPLASGDGPAQVAAALAGLIAVDRTATAEGGLLTVPGTHSLKARVVAGGTERRETRRLQQSIQISAWAPSPSTRDALIRIVDEALIEDHRTLVMPDGTKATIDYEGTAYDEAARQQPLHRRDLVISAEYTSVRTRTAPGIAVPVTEIEPEPARIKHVVIS